MGKGSPMTNIRYRKGLGWEIFYFYIANFYARRKEQVSAISSGSSSLFFIQQYFEKHHANIIKKWGNHTKMLQFNIFDVST